MGKTVINATSYCIMQSVRSSQSYRARNRKRFGGMKTITGYADDVSENTDSLYLKTALTNEELAQKIKNEETNNQNENTDFVVSDIVQRIAQKRTQAILESVLLINVFNSDDGKISFQEKRAIKKHFKSYRKLLTERDEEDIINCEKYAQSVDSIKLFIDNRNIPIESVEQAIHAIKKICVGTGRYYFIIENLKKHLLN